MMKKEIRERAAEKLKSQGGASLLLALMFFLICALAGSVVLSIAQTYEKRTAANLQEEREYLAVLSAAEFLKGQLKLCEGQWNLDGSGFGVDAPADNRVQKELLETICEFCRNYVTYGAEPESQMNLKIGLEDEGDVNRTMPDAQVRIVLESPGEISAETPEEGMIKDRDDMDGGSEEGGGRQIPIRITAECFIEGKEKSGTRLSAEGTAVYEDKEMMEIHWDKAETGKIIERIY